MARVRAVIIAVVTMALLGLVTGWASAAPKAGAGVRSAGGGAVGAGATPAASQSTGLPAGLPSGTLIVGKDIQPGTYKAVATDPLAYWSRLKDASGDLSSTIANDNAEEGDQAVVTVAATDYAFESDGFSGWVPASGPSLMNGKLGSGTLIVGQDIQPGTYKATVTGTLGYWARMKDTLGTSSSIIANDDVESGQAVVTISPTDKAFKSSGFSDWTKV